MAVIKKETFHEAWDCSVCGTEGLSVYDCKQCPNCGAPFDEEGVYRTRRPVENYKFKGHDVICAHCETRNEKRFSCRNCGASLTDGDDVRVDSFTYRSDTDFKPSPKGRPQKSTSRSRPTRKSDLSTTTRPSDGENTRKWWIIGGVAAVVILSAIIWIVNQLNAVIPATLTADRAHWAYHLSLEDYNPRQKTMTVEDGGFGSLPSDAYRVNSNRVFIRSEPVYETRSVSQTCTGTTSQSNGDGTWTETTYTYDCSYTVQEQVGTNSIWGTRYDFTVDRWEPITPLTKDGWGQTPDFPTFTTPERCLSNNPPYGCKRALNEPRLTFTVHFFYHKEGDGMRHNVSRDMERHIWETISLDSDYPAVLNGFGEIRAIQGIDPEYDELMAK